ncbi:MAG: 50S ribosomal protein L11 methyltransferase [Oscillospiraceae bacterium]|jgi:ribosomal protein L11 methyltransferase|nr:50S ribosomal protein L11 methyltransferase [Oscillospiraceae bacterium]
MDNQSWTQFDIYTSTQGVEPLGAALIDIGYPAFAIQDPADFEKLLKGESGRWDYIDDDLMKLKDAETTVTVYLPDNEQGRDGLMAVADALARLKALDTVGEWGRLTHTLSGVNEEDWASAWKKYYKPFKIGPRLIVCPSWEDYAPKAGETVMKLDPGMAFGTGTHESTRLCLDGLQEMISGGESVLDIGCGSGILSIAALLLGAKQALGVDIDAVAVRVAEENAALNGVGNKARYLCGNLTDHVTGRYDIICANIVADIIIQLSETVPDYMNPGGLFLVSGIIDTRAYEVLSFAEGQGFRLKSRRDDGGWVSMLFGWERPY